MKKPILCLDFDGVIHSYTSGWKGAHIIPDPPVDGTIDALLGYLDAGFEVAIFSSRSKNPLGRLAMKHWLGTWLIDHWVGGSPHPIYSDCECTADVAALVTKFKWPWFKPAALMTIDDRAMTFNGKWHHFSPDIIRGFRPWNKK